MAPQQTLDEIPIESGCTQSASWCLHMIDMKIKKIKTTNWWCKEYYVFGSSGTGNEINEMKIDAIESVEASFPGLLKNPHSLRFSG